MSQSSLLRGRIIILMFAKVLSFGRRGFYSISSSCGIDDFLVGTAISWFTARSVGAAASENVILARCENELGVTKSFVYFPPKTNRQLFGNQHYNLKKVLT